MRAAEENMTNADIYRNATDQQLAILLTNIALEAIKCYGNFEGIPREAIDSFHLEWLKQEAEET